MVAVQSSTIFYCVANGVLYWFSLFSLSVYLALLFFFFAFFFSPLWIISFRSVKLAFSISLSFEVPVNVDTSSSFIIRFRFPLSRILISES